MLSVCIGGWPRPGPLQGRPTMAWLPASGGRLRPGPQQGATARRGSSPQGTTTHKGQPCHQQGRRHQSQEWPLLGKAAAGRKGQSPPAQ
ncbi:hypothetical protein BHE74_00015658 [Ensete ventricosum]|nr:hypothetical protein GW17_00058280 [Ensete ventricosum]RWW76264.1 hypothetical protein BHE74_00015658 [Ensete ventricosum]RZR97990.1 hypothetical protein BHM03_00027279 [Ensete ventricosum]